MDQMSDASREASDNGVVIDLTPVLRCPGFIHLNRFAKRWCEKNCEGQHNTTQSRAAFKLASAVMRANATGLGRSIDEELWYKHASGKYFHAAALPAMAKEFYGDDVVYDAAIAERMIGDADATIAARRTSSPTSRSQHPVQAQGHTQHPDVEQAASASLRPHENITAGAVTWWTQGEDASAWWHAAAPRIQTTHQLRASLTAVDLPCNVVLQIHRGSGMVRGSDIAVSAGKQIVKWCGHTCTRNVAQAVSEKYQVVLKDLAVVVPNGVWQGTWVHMCMVNDLARWCNPVYAVHTDDIVMRFFNGTLTTEESQAARATVDASASTPMATPIPAPQSEDGRSIVNARRRVRSTSVRIPIKGVPIPKHLMHMTGIYMGVWGSVECAGASEQTAHFKLGKSVDQPVVARINQHYAEKPHTFQLLYVAGAEAGFCNQLELAMKNAMRALGHQQIANSHEEYYVPLSALSCAVEHVTKWVHDHHSDMLVTADCALQPKDQFRLKMQYFADLAERAECEQLRHTYIQAMIEL